jgi:hypothetical protein
LEFASVETNLKEGVVLGVFALSKSTEEFKVGAPGAAFVVKETVVEAEDHRLDPVGSIA